MQDTEQSSDSESGNFTTPSQIQTKRILRDGSKIKLPSRFDVNVAEIVPETYSEAINNPGSERWIEAINEELNAHKENKTWSLIPIDTSKKLLDSKWIFKIMKDETGKINRYKARLVPKGFQQREGLDYTETFSPVVRHDSLRTFLALSTLKDLELIQFDVKTAFLHGKQNDELYIKLPQGLKINPKFKSGELMCKLNKSIYGIKQAARC